MSNQTMTDQPKKQTKNDTNNLNGTMTNQTTNQPMTTNNKPNSVAVLSQYPDSPPNVRGIEIRVSYLIYIKSGLV